MKPGTKEVMFIEKQIQAVLDLDEIADYLSELGGFSLAERFLEQTEAAFAQLSEYPEIGKPLPTTRAAITGLRRWAIEGFSNYLIFYLAQRDKIVIVRVGHSAQNWMKILGIE